MAHITVEVPPLSRKQIREIAYSVRKVLRWDEPYFPIVEVIEHLLPRLDENFVFIVETASEMGDEHGRTFPDENVIMIRDDVYEGACDGQGRDRMTMAHELGHLILHEGLPLSRRVPRETIPAYRSSEWQANCFGGELLISAQHINQCADYLDAITLFGVTDEAAQTQWEAFLKDKIFSR